MRKWLIGVITAGVCLVSACSAESGGAYSPDQIVANAVEKEDQLDRYYMKMEMDVQKGDDTIDRSTMEQWSDVANNRIKVIADTEGGAVQSLNDGKTTMFYSEEQGEAFTIDSPGTEQMLSGESQREQLQQMLQETRKTHDVELIGEEEVNGFGTYHIKAVPKEDGGFRGNEEYWISDKHWIIIKMVAHSEDLKTEYTVTELDVDPSFDDRTFTMDLPQGVEVKEMDDLGLTEETSLEEAEEIYGQPVLKVKDEAYELTAVDRFSSKELKRTEVNQSYSKDGYGQFTLTSFEAPEDNLSAGFSGEEIVEVRGTKGVFTEDVITNLLWEEGGLRYSLLVEDPELTKEEIFAIAEALE
ncbi:hypothetical protein QRD89_11250 [Halobacillus sp. ACCC02827]|uniref:LolA family protein n=1 Tax=Bacillaceae TaxID=186817 RepID=UPI00041918D9|nr:MULTISPECIES: hypothetical protein [Bacillaceae]QHT47074.1 hypothetical protein M662_11415 [Bacillus sp. SB49]WJE14302.1 hypothetical protein QRD89_11250 [Halobacillus sp. ACCC02827]